MLNSVARILDVFFRPVHAMRAVLHEGGWLVPCLFMVLCGVLFDVLAGDTMTEFVNERLEALYAADVAEGRLNPEEADRLLERRIGSSRNTIRSLTIVSALLGKLMYATLLLLVGHRVLGGSQSFGRYWSLVWYVGVIGALDTAVSGLLIGITNDPQGCHLGLAALTKSAPHSTLHHLARLTDAFFLWEAIVAGIGLSVFTGCRIAKGVLWGLIVYVGSGLLLLLLVD